MPRREYGVTPRYVAFCAWSNGVTRKHRRGAKDARWERAKPIGAVIA
jgi:hypothetical protein